LTRKKCPQRRTPIPAPFPESSVSIGALELQIQAVEILRDVRPADNPRVATARHSLASLAFETGNVQEAKDLYSSALENRRRNLPPLNPRLAATLTGLGGVYCETGDTEEAVSLIEEGLEIYRSVLPDEHPLVIRTREKLNLCTGR
jgi:tetratricopeptide (TPR) repeat protein